MAEHERTTLLAAACGVLVLTLGLQVASPMGDVLPLPPGLAPRRVKPFSVPAEPTFNNILRAPIFAPDRRPGPPGTSVMPGGGALAGYAALGAAVGRSVATAVVALPSGQLRTLRRGEDMDGWTLVAMDRTRLTFQRKNARHDLIVGAPAEAASSTTAPSVQPTTTQP